MTNSMSFGGPVHRHRICQCLLCGLWIHYIGGYVILCWFGGQLIDIEFAIVYMASKLNILEATQILCNTTPITNSEGPRGHIEFCSFQFSCVALGFLPPSACVLLVFAPAVWHDSGRCPDVFGRFQEALRKLCGSFLKAFGMHPEGFCKVSKRFMEGF